MSTILLGQGARSTPEQKQFSIRPPLIGSSWDAGPSGPDAPLPHHLREWVKGSAVAAELAAANVVSLQGAAVLEALVGDWVDANYSTHTQYVTTGNYGTGGIARRLRPLEPIAEAGGWWVAGLDPNTSWQQEQSWGTFRPDVPRLDPEKGTPLKYEHPHGVSTRLLWLKVPAAIAQRVADRFALALPPEVVADADGARGAFWRWWAATPALPAVLTEGAKKAGAIFSAGVPAVALPGIWNGCPNGALHPDLAALPLAGRPLWVLFDRSDRPNPAEPKAARRLGRLLQKAGGKVRVGICPGPGKGADDHLVGGGSWEQLAAAMVPLQPAPVLPRLPQAHHTAPAGAPMGQSLQIPSPEHQKVVAVVGAMGAGKTFLVEQHVQKEMANGRRVVLITHRRSLGAALAQRLGLPWGDDAAPGSDLRQTGIALCVDSLCRESGMRFCAADYRGALVVIDEADAVLHHALNTAETAIARRRGLVLSELGALLQQAGQILLAGAQLDCSTIAAVEAAAGGQALVLSSAHQPAAGRRLIVHPTRDSWRAQLVALLQQRKRLWIATTAQQGGMANSAQAIAALVAQHWPGARVLVVDSHTTADPEHDAHRLAEDPDGIAFSYDVVVATPAVAAGLSVTLTGHFDGVLVAAGGNTDPESIAQAAGRVRDDAPRHLYAPERSPGNKLSVGCGYQDPAAMLHHLAEHERIVVSQLVAAGYNPTTGTSGPWLNLWAQQNARRNGARLAYRATVVALLQREGYLAQEAAPMGAEEQAVAQTAATDLQAITTAAQAAEDDAIRTAVVITTSEAQRLEQRRHLQPAERAQLQRHRIAQRWGLAEKAPSDAILAAERDGTHQRLRFRWMVQNDSARTLAAQADLATGATSWAPDRCRQALGPRLALADALSLRQWLERIDWFSADDLLLQQTHATTTAYAAGVRQVLGISAAATPVATLRRLLALVGCRLEVRRRRHGGGRLASAPREYRVIHDPLPDGVDLLALEGAMAHQLVGGCVPIPPI